MAAQTYKYFQPDSVLRAAYGGGSIQTAADSAEVTPATLTSRHIFKNIDFLSKQTKHLWEVGTASSVVWIRVTDNLYPAISSLLSATELSTVTSTAPVGFAVTTAISQLQLSADRRNIIICGDSLSEGLNSIAQKRGIYAVRAIESIDNMSATFSESDRVVTTRSYQITNTALSSSSYDNTVGATPETTYPLRSSLAYNQRIRTLPIKANDIVFLWWGTNDLSYDLALTPAQCWSRAVARVNAIKTNTPCKVAIATLIKRSQNTTSNARLNDYNNLVRANYASVGIDAICDFEALVPQVNIITGVTGDEVYYSDSTHLTDLGQETITPIFRSMLQSL